MKITSLTTLLFFLGLTAFAQNTKGLEGLWTGTMSIGGLNSQKTVRFQLYLDVEGNDISGKSIVYLEDGQIVEMELKGHMYYDRSVYMEDVKFLPLKADQGVEETPPFFRKYQFIYNRSIWESSLDGYWQQINKSPLDNKRRRGKISLKKVKSKV